MMTWNPDKTVNQVTFTPSYFDGNAPFGNSGIVHWYAYRKVVGPNISNDDIEEDYVVLVLDQRLGDICGWMGTRGYDNAWNGLQVWSHIGYPGDLPGGSRPTYQGDIPVDSTSGSSADEDLWHKGDVWPGQSGGSYFAWFGNEPWARACGVQSGQNASTNSAGGGYYISNLVNRARTDFARSRFAPPTRAAIAPTNYLPLAQRRLGGSFRRGACPIKDLGRVRSSAAARSGPDPSHT